MATSVFRSAWSWLVPLIGAGVVFVLVLATTPPGLAAVEAVAFSSAADAAAYAAAAAASLALVTLLALAAVCGALEALLRRFR
jgi:hypothetical protein